MPLHALETLREPSFVPPAADIPHMERKETIPANRLSFHELTCNMFPEIAGTFRRRKRCMHDGFGAGG
jgi:hypothetical protein